MEIVMAIMQISPERGIKRQEERDVSKIKAWSENSRSRNFGLHDRAMFKWRKEVRILI